MRQRRQRLEPCIYKPRIVPHARGWKRREGSPLDSSEQAPPTPRLHSSDLWDRERAHSPCVCSRGSGTLSWQPRKPDRSPSCCRAQQPPGHLRQRWEEACRAEAGLRGASTLSLLAPHTPAMAEVFPFAPCPWKGVTLVPSRF